MEISIFQTLNRKFTEMKYIKNMNTLVIQPEKSDLDLFRKFLINLQFLHCIYSTYIPENLDSYDLILVDESIQIPIDSKRYTVIFTDNKIPETKSTFVIQKPINWKDLEHLLIDLSEINTWNLQVVPNVAIEPQKVEDVIIFNYNTTPNGVESCAKNISLALNMLPIPVQNNIQNILEEIAIYFYPVEKHITAYVYHEKDQVCLSIKNPINFLPFCAKRTSDCIKMNRNSLDIVWMR